MPMSVMELSIIDTSGDTKVKWDPDNPAEVENARATFDRLKAQGFVAFSTKKKKPGQMLTAFDPSAETLIMAPPMTAG